MTITMQGFMILAIIGTEKDTFSILLDVKLLTDGRKVELLSIISTEKDT